LSNLNFIIESYNAEVEDLPRLYKEDGGGKARNASGVIFERTLFSAFVLIMVLKQRKMTTSARKKLMAFVLRTFKLINTSIVMM